SQATKHKMAAHPQVNPPSSVVTISVVKGAHESVAIARYTANARMPSAKGRKVNTFSGSFLTVFFKMNVTSATPSASRSDCQLSLKKPLRDWIADITFLTFSRRTDMIAHFFAPRGAACRIFAFPRTDMHIVRRYETHSACRSCPFACPRAA